MKNNVKITSGLYKGQIILTPGPGTHPMGSREKLALFNMIAAVLPDAKVLDAFAGSGALGIEALSRGAKSVTFVEKSPAAIRVIKNNLAKLGLSENAEVINTDIGNYFTNERFDIILADPPYDNFDAQKIQQIVSFLKESGVLVLSHPDDPPLFNDLPIQKTNSYAGAKISVYYR